MKNQVEIQNLTQFRKEVIKKLLLEAGVDESSSITTAMRDLMNFLVK